MVAFEADHSTPMTSRDQDVQYSTRLRPAVDVVADNISITHGAG